MPDIFFVFSRRWKLVVLFTLLATAAALIACWMSPKKYLGVATALPANPFLSDKARIFNQNIEALYSELGSADELDKFEGTAKLDTIYLAAAAEFNLATHYGLNTTEKNVLTKAAKQLQKNTLISRSGYGELKINVWDKSNAMAADLANALLQKLNDIHQHLQTENNRLVLQQLKDAYAAKANALSSAERSLNAPPSGAPMNVAVLTAQLQQYSQLITEYELALKTTPNVLLVVERARAQPSPDKPNTGQTVLVAFFAALFFSVLLVYFLESRNQKS